MREGGSARVREGESERERERGSETDRQTYGGTGRKNEVGESCWLWLNSLKTIEADRIRLIR